MTLRINSCEGGTPGTNVTSTNSSDGTSGDALALSPSNTTALQYASSSARNGSVGHRYVVAAAAAVYCQGIIDAAGRGALSFAMRFDALPTSDTTIAAIRHTSGWMAKLRIKASNGTLEVHQATGYVATLAGTLTAGTWYRFELAAEKGTTTADGKIDARYGPDGGAITDTYSSTTRNTGTTDAAYARFGVPESGGAMNFDVDSYMWEDKASGFIGAWPTNFLPNVDAGGNQTVAPGATVNLAASADDPDGSIASYAWTFDETPAAAPTINGSTTATPNFVASPAGRYVVRCTVTDNSGGSSFDTVTVYAATTGEVLANANLNATESGGAWSNVGGAATKGAAVSDASDATYIESPTVSGTATRSKLLLQPSTVRSAPTLTVRVRKSDAGALTCNVKLYEGATLRKTWTGIAITTSFADVALALTSGEAAAITDWNTLSVEFEATT